jgi:hypothetical protein
LAPAVEGFVAVVLANGSHVGIPWMRGLWRPRSAVGGRWWMIGLVGVGGQEWVM